LGKEKVASLTICIIDQNSSNLKNLKIAIFPNSIDSSNPYQQLFAKSLENLGATVVFPSYKNPFPILQCIIKCWDFDIIIFDWLHSVYTSKSITSTISKTILGEIERIIIKLFPYKPVLIWNLHNLHRHDLAFQDFERWSFTRLSTTVDGIRVFNELSLKLAAEYLKLREQTIIKSIPHGNYIEVYEGIGFTSLRKEWNVKDDDIVLLLFGGLREGKGILKFINIFSSVSNSYPNIKLIIAGKPENISFEKEIRFLATGNDSIVLKLELIPNSEVPSFFHSSNYAVLPYDHILNSGSAVLAMGFGKPIIANAIPIFLELLKPSFSFVENIHSEQGFTKIINLIMSETKPMKSEMALNAKIEAHALSWHEIAKQVIIYAEELKERKKEKRKHNRHY
jgi:glycosyltransferase involved in cell wall biosynthesis